jgi:hypothetical protein
VARSAGDFDGDGLGDVALGAYLAPDIGERSQSGIIDVLFGSREIPAAIDLADECEFRILGKHSWDHAGRFLATGDLDGDGKDELLVGIPLGDPQSADGSLRLQAGLLGIVRGRAKSEFPDSLDLATASFDHLISGIDAEDQMPMGIAVVDLDGDAKRDLVVGVPLASARANDSPQGGEVYFLLGKSRSW